MERCGKINASNSGSDSWTGIGVVAGFCTVVLIMQWPQRRNGEVTWGSELLQRLQEVRGNCKTRNQLNLCGSHPLRRLASITCSLVCEEPHETRLQRIELLEFITVYT